MEFIKRMKKREFIEMGLKTLAAVLAAFLAIILMEGMIYSIKLNALKTKGHASASNSGTTIAYCIKQAEDEYFVVYYDKAENGEDIWSCVGSDTKTKAECEKLAAKEIKFNAPSAFKLSITPTHYIVMAVFMLAVGGFFTYKFIALSKEYKEIEDQYQKTGTIEF